ncbi:MAG: SprT-like domain-containing protein [Kofleriaceae bacterium]
MPIDPPGLSAELEAALLRELRRCYHWQNHVRFAGKLVPAVLALSDTARRLGQWSPHERTIELSRRLVIEQPWTEVMAVLEHEMAHQFVDEVLEVRDESAHGETFRRVCEDRGIDGRAAGSPQPSRAEPGEIARVLDKIRKLLALAGSPNQHEAEAAMRRAHELMLRHNIEQADTRREFEVRCLGTPRQRTHGVEAAIVGLISEFFFVKAIRIRTYMPREAAHAFMYEITGTRANVEMAEHVFEFLLATAERLWRDNRGDARVRDGRDRLSYQAGVVGGFREKLLLERSSLSGTGLVWVGDPTLDEHYRRRYPRIVTTRRTSRLNRAHLAGREAGRTVVLHKPITNASGGGDRKLLRG